MMFTYKYCAQYPFYRGKTVETNADKFREFGQVERIDESEAF